MNNFLTLLKSNPSPSIDSRKRLMLDIIDDNQISCFMQNIMSASSPIFRLHLLGKEEIACYGLSIYSLRGDALFMAIAVLIGIWTYEAYNNDKKSVPDIILQDLPEYIRRRDYAWKMHGSILLPAATTARDLADVICVGIFNYLPTESAGRAYEEKNGCIMNGHGLASCVMQPVNVVNAMSRHCVGISTDFARSFGEGYLASYSNNTNWKWVSLGHT